MLTRGIHSGRESTEFWSGFAADSYRRTPFELADPPVALRISADEMFELLLRSCQLAGARPQDPRVKFFIAQRPVMEDAEDYLPKSADRSLDGYLARLEEQLQGQPYVLVVQRMHAASRELWKKAAGFLNGLYEATGVIPGGAEVEAFVGHYPHTPGAIHRERSGVFVSMVCGSKDILVWPPETIGLPLESARYEFWRSSARTLRCERDKLVYWPAMHWHIAECPDGPSAGIHVAALEQGPDLADLLSASTGGMARFIGAGLDWPEGVQNEVLFPHQYEAVAEALAHAYGSAGDVRDRLTADWLRRRTGFGFAAPPPRHGDVELRPEDRVVRDDDVPIVLAPRDRATSWCAADGRVARLRSAPALTQLVDLINAGDPIMAGGALALATSPADRQLLEIALSLLVDWDAVRVMPTG